MKVNFGRLRRLVYSALALAVVGAATIPALTGTASAAQVTSRAIKMSSSAIGSVAAGQNVSYEITFNVATAGAVQAVVVDFCSNSPLPGTACTAPTGFDVGAGTTTGSIAGMTGTWSGASANSGRTLNLTLGTPGGSAAGGAAASFTLTTVTNPTSAVGTFYARIFTFTSAANATTWLSTTDGSDVTGVVDSGGIALSTADQVTVTAKVQETLTFCVYDGANCAAGATGVTLGDSNGVLSTSASYVDTSTQYNISSNAANGVSIRLKGDTLKSGSNSITALTSATASNPGQNQFGLCSYRAAGGAGLLAVQAPYDDATCASTTSGANNDAGALFALDTNITDGTMSDYGDVLATMAAGEQDTGVIAFLGNVSATQPAGIYTSTFTFIATGTY